MKQSQIYLAVAVLVVGMFVVTFAMSYLGGSNQTPAPILDTSDKPEPAELVFSHKVFPPEKDGFPSIETEERSIGYADYWFQNPKDVPIRLGLHKKSCKCTSVLAFVLPPNSSPRLAGGAAALVGVSMAGPGFAWGRAVAFEPWIRQTMAKGLEGQELLKDGEVAEVPPHGSGWVRLKYTGEKPGKSSLQANLWMDNRDTGKTALLELRLNFLEPLRVKGLLEFGKVKEEELTAGVTRDIYCYSSTRRSLTLEAKVAHARLEAKSDPFVLGTPVPLTGDELREFERRANAADGDVGDGVHSGPIHCAYRIPVTLRAVSPDGKTPFDLGPFRRWVLVSCPDLNAEGKAVRASGQIRGPIDLGGEEVGGEVNLRVFQGSRGKKETIYLSTDVPGMTLAFDRQRTPEFLSATVQPGKESGDGRRTWGLRIEVVPGKAQGTFPRREDPRFTDAAIYLKAAQAGKPDRTIRVGVGGTASE